MLMCKVKSAEQETIDVQDVLIRLYPAVSWWARPGIFKSGSGVPQGPVRGHLGVLFNTDTDFEYCLIVLAKNWSEIKIYFSAVRNYLL